MLANYWESWQRLKAVNQRSSAMINSLLLGISIPEQMRLQHTSLLRALARRTTWQRFFPIALNLHLFILQLLNWGPYSLQ